MNPSASFSRKRGAEMAPTNITGPLLMVIPKLPGSLWSSGIVTLCIPIRLDGAWFESKLREVDRSAITREILYNHEFRLYFYWEFTLVLGRGGCVCVWMCVCVWICMCCLEAGKCQQFLARQLEEGKSPGYSSHWCGDFQQQLTWAPRTTTNFTVRLKTQPTQPHASLPQTVQKTLQQRATVDWPLEQHSGAIYLNKSDLGNDPLAEEGSILWV